jgi:hypothetical protein
LFEAELLTRLMLWRWGHPLADDADAVNDLLESTATVLRKSAQEGERFYDDIHAENMNFVAALCYVEWAAITSDPPSDHDGRRMAWLNAVRHALPSCFSDPGDLHDV